IFFLIYLLFKPKVKWQQMDTKTFQEQYTALGKVTKGQKIVFALFISLALLWIFRSDIQTGLITIPGWSNILKYPQFINDGTVAVAIAILLFMIPAPGNKGKKIMDWETAKRLPWNIVILLGGGVSVGAHKNGKVIDVNNALDGDGPFSPERSGSLPVGQLAKLCFSGEVSYEEVKKIITGQGGLVAYLGTNDAYQVEMMVRNGDDKAKLIQNALAYQVAKEIGSMATVLKGKVDGILLTGGMAHNPLLVDYVRNMVEFLAPLSVYPGEDEMQALAMNGLRVLKGETKPKVYSS
ncbi:MAG: butyrate kinase, partial [Bacteroidota bacterium]